MAPMSSSLGGADGRVTADQIAFYQERARGGFGLIVVEFTSVDPATGRTEAHQLSLEADRQLDGHYRLIDALHASGAKAFLQLQHGGRFAVAKYLKDGIVRGPSPVYSRRDPTKLIVEEMDDALIRYLIDAFAAAASRAARAGYDGIELHGAHGYLLSQFLSPISNYRDDAWGGDGERRMAFPLAVIRAVRSAIGDLPFCYRISADEFVPGGLDIDATSGICQHLVAAGVDILHASTGRGPQSFDKVMGAHVGAGGLALAVCPPAAGSGRGAGDRRRANPPSGNRGERDCRRRLRFGRARPAIADRSLLAGESGGGAVQTDPGRAPPATSASPPRTCTASAVRRTPAPVASWRRRSRSTWDRGSARWWSARVRAGSAPR